MAFEDGSHLSREVRLGRDWYNQELLASQAAVDMSDTLSLPDRYLGLIDQIIQMTLKGQIRSKEQVYQLLIEGIDAGTGEIFERCLQARTSEFQEQATGSDELKQAKATRSLRALQTVQGEWERWQTENQSHETITQAIQAIGAAAPEHRLAAFLRAIDPNAATPVTLTELKSMGLALQAWGSNASDPTLQQDLTQIADGIRQGLAAWTALQDHLVRWLYEPAQDLGFGSPAQGSDPWSWWAKSLKQPLILALFQKLSLNESVIDWGASLQSLEVSAWVELAIVLQLLQQNLVIWFERQAYSAKLGSTASISTFLAFSVLWAQIAQGLDQATIGDFHRHRFADGSFQISLQILRMFSQRSYFPLYGGVFAALPGSRWQSIVSYLSEPLKQVEGTQEQARILTLIGSATRAQGRLEQAKEMHEFARNIASAAGDRPCEIANLNHLSRTCAVQKHYAEAIDHSQRALILSRQFGDRAGEANALVNLGYSEVFQANAREQADPDAYETAISYLQQGLKLAEQLDDRQSQAFGYNSLGIGYLLIDQVSDAKIALTEGLKAAQFAGDLYLQGLDLAYLAEVYYRQQAVAEAIYAACLSMYYLDRITSRDWRQSAGLLTILQGQLGDNFQAILQQQRREIIAAIGIEGYEYIPTLLEHYRQTDR